MDNVLKLKRVFVFISSPGDVAKARENVRYAVNRINKLIAKDFGVLFEPIGWEDIPPEKQKRAQEQINKYVDRSNIFIGILNQRFGTTTGIADSGTEEEYNRITSRWDRESVKPTVWIYFKKVPIDRLDDPDKQLSKVLKFKKTIASTDFYHEFNADDDIIEEIEDALGEWLRNNKEVAIQECQKEFRFNIEDEDLSTLLDIILDKNKINEPIQKTEPIKKLLNQKLVYEENGKYNISNSTNSFVRIVRLFIDTKYYKDFLESEFFKKMLKIHIRGIVQNRQHCNINVDQEKVLIMILTVSPSALSYILFGDTVIFDNTIEQAHQINKIEMVNNQIWESILSSVLRFYIQDTMDNKAYYQINDKEIIGQVITIKVSTVFEEGRAFEASVKIPIMRYRVKSLMKRGQLVTISPELHIQNGLLFFYMGEYQLAINEYDKLIETEDNLDLKVAALNNKGVVLLNIGKSDEAKISLEKALQLKPSLNEAKENLKLIKSI